MSRRFPGEEPVSFLRCYLYDPTTGKFGAVVQWTVRILGIATVIVLAGGVTSADSTPAHQSIAGIE
ncbi:MAG: hypothetical protein R3B91_07685 [Planctomycetaceae bacterium]